MDKTFILKILNLPLGLVVLAVSITYIVTSEKPRSEYLALRRSLNAHNPPPELLASISYLKYAEDHRFDYHWGFDLVAIFRAVYRYIAFRKVEGASTITQQFVRTYTKRYELNLFRKLHEISLACLISFTSKKDDIACAYLTIAYYGAGISSPSDAINYLNNILSPESRNHPVLLAALLKYPIPPTPSAKWVRKLTNRIEHILCRCRKYD